MVEHYYKMKTYDARKSIGYLVRSSSNLLTAKVGALFAEKELTFVQYVILMNLRYKIAENCGALCQNLNYDSGALTRVIDQLEERKFIERQRCTTDRRVVKLHLTELGKEMTETVLPIVIEQYNQWLENFTREEADTLIHLLTKLIANMSEPSSGARG